MRNPRRHFNSDGSMSLPATVGSQQALGLTRAEIWCSECHHHAEVSTEGLPDDLAIPDICLRYRCSKCRSKRLLSRPSVAEHYERLATTTGKKHGMT
jgi:ribosomal protein L44E